MHSVTLQEAEGHLAELASLAASGKRVVIRCSDGTLLRLVPEKAASRVFGQYEGQIKASDDFDDELPESYWLGTDEP